MSLQSYTRVVRILALRCEIVWTTQTCTMCTAAPCGSAFTQTRDELVSLAQQLCEHLTLVGHIVRHTRCHLWSADSAGSPVFALRRAPFVCVEGSTQDGARSCPSDRLSGLSCFSVYLTNNPISTQRARVSCMQFTWVVCHRCCTGGFQCRTASSIGHRTDVFIYVRARNLAAAGHYHEDGRSHRAYGGLTRHHNKTTYGDEGGKRESRS